MIFNGYRIFLAIFSYTCYQRTRFVAGNPNMVVAFAGNKADLEDKRKVTAEVSIIVFSVSL